jgi:hypothetical protein
MFNLYADDYLLDDIIDMLSTRDEWGEPIVRYYFQMDECPTLSDAIKCACQYYKTDVSIQPAF